MWVTRLSINLHLAKQDSHNMGKTWQKSHPRHVCVKNRNLRGRCKCLQNGSSVSTRFIFHENKNLHISHSNVIIIHLTMRWQRMHRMSFSLKNTAMLCFKSHIVHLYLFFSRSIIQLALKNVHIYKLTSGNKATLYPLLCISNQCFKRRHRQLNSTWLQDNGRQSNLHKKEELIKVFLIRTVFKSGFTYTN